MNSLKKARIEKGLSQKEAAKAIGISYSLLVKLENGLRGASDKNKVKIALFYDSTVQDIFFDNSITNSEGMAR
ncbi:helix-turn-helix transcriptional regulator [Enterococcus casseliflavus]